MTREEAIESFECSNKQAKLRLEVEKMRMDISEVKELEFYIERDDMAIKALEQEDAIEKIRSEVEDINPWAIRYAPLEDGDTRPKIVTNVKSHVLEIIDKYKEDT